MSRARWLLSALLVLLVISPGATEEARAAESPVVVDPAGAAAEPPAGEDPGATAGEEVAPPPEDVDVPDVTAEVEVAPPATADGDAVVAILPLRVDGELPAHVVAAMEVDVESALQRGDHTVLSAAEVAARSPQARRCEVAQCYQSIAQATRARFLVQVDAAVEGRDYTFSLELLDGETGLSIGHTEAMCDICGHDEARESLVNEAATLGRKITAKQATRPPTLVVHTAPQGCQVRYDGELLGVTPIEGAQVEPGEHDIVVQKPGYISQRRRVAFVDGVTEALDFTLERDPGYVDPATARRRSLMRTLGWTGVGLGAGALVGGVVLIALEERPIAWDCTGDNVDIEGNCRYRYATLEGGIALAAAGVAVLATGVTLLVLERRRGRVGGSQRASAARVRLAPSPSGFALRF